MTAFPIGLLILLVFTNRYFVGLFWKRVRGDRFDAFTTTTLPTGPGLLGAYGASSAPPRLVARDLRAAPAIVGGAPANG